MSGIYEVVLKTPNGQERKALAFLPTEFVRRDIQEKAERCGMKATLNPLTSARGERNDKPVLDHC